MEARVKSDVLSQIEASPTEISKRQVFSLAQALAVPVQLLFFSKLAIDENIPDFRTVRNRPAVLTSSGLTRLERAKSILAYLSDGVFVEDEPFALTASVKVGETEKAIKSLNALYVPIRRSDGSVDPSATFRETRVSMERRGIIVLCDRVNDGFRGFCFAQRDNFPLIFINTTGQRPATKLFTLMHEAVHIFVGSTGVSDPSILRNKTERFCNAVAASVMMPRDEFAKLYESIEKLPTRTAATALARHFGASKQAAALRVSELGLNDSFYANWQSSLPKKIPSIEEEDEDEAASGGGGLSSQLSRFGYLLPNMLGAAISKRLISPVDTYRLTNLRPATVNKLATMGANRLGQ